MRGGTNRTPTLQDTLLDGAVLLESSLRACCINVNILSTNTVLCALSGLCRTMQSVTARGVANEPRVAVVWSSSCIWRVSLLGQFSRGGMPERGGCITSITNQESYGATLDAGDPAPTEFSRSSCEALYPRQSQHYAASVSTSQKSNTFFMTAGAASNHSAH